MPIIDIKEATEATKALPDFFNALSQVVLTVPGAILTIFVVFYFLVIRKDALKFSEVFSHRSTTRLASIEKYLSGTGSRDANCAAALLDMHEAEIFRVATGIYAAKLRRDALIQLHARVQHLADWRTIRFALRNIVFDKDGRVTIREFGFWDKTGYYYNWCIAILALGAAAGSVAVLVFSEGLNWEIGAVLVSFAVLAIFASFVAGLQNRPYIFSNRIRAELEKLRSAGSTT